MRSPDHDQHDEAFEAVKYVHPDFLPPGAPPTPIPPSPTAFGYTEAGVLQKIAEATGVEPNIVDLALCYGADVYELRKVAAEAASTFSVDITELDYDYLDHLAYVMGEANLARAAANASVKRRRRQKPPPSNLQRTIQELRAAGISESVTITTPDGIIVRLNGANDTKPDAAAEDLLSKL